MMNLLYFYRKDTLRSSINSSCGLHTAIQIKNNGEAKTKEQQLLVN